MHKKEIVVIKIFITSLLSLVLLGKVNAADFLFSLIHHTNLVFLQEVSSLVVFNNGDYIFDSNTGSFGLCGQSSSAGRFKGQFDQKTLKSFSQALSELSVACTKIKDCTKGQSTASLTNSWIIRDYTQKDTGYEVSGNVLPKLISIALDKQSQLKNQPIDALTFSRKGNQFSLEYSGDNELKVNLSLENFFVLESGGSLANIKNYCQKKCLFKTRKETLSAQNKAINFELPFDLEKHKAKIHFMIFSTAMDTPSFNLEKRNLFPCLKL